MSLRLRWIDSFDDGLERSLPTGELAVFVNLDRDELRWYDDDPLSAYAPDALGPRTLRRTADRDGPARRGLSDRTVVENASDGQHAAIVALGAAHPFRRMPSMTVRTHNILMALEAALVSRFVYLSADTVDRRCLNFLRRRVIVPLLLATTAADHELDEAMIRHSRVAWMIVRPPMLTNGARTGRYCAGESLQAETPIPRISRADVAAFMLDQLEDDQFLGQAPTSCRALGPTPKLKRKRHDRA